MKDGRFLLITDIGIVTKQAADNHEEVFLLSIKEQKPIAGATVQILGKNGIAAANRADRRRRTLFVHFGGKEAKERSPVAIVARLGDDVSFIPYDRQDRILNFSRFDIEGVESGLPESLDAFVFTERGIYRPGRSDSCRLDRETTRLGREPEGACRVEVEVLDARDTKVQTKKPQPARNRFHRADLPDG